MNTYRRLLRYAGPYWKRAAILFVVITVFASLNGLSLTLIPPFLKILLHEGEIEPASIESQIGVKARAYRFLHRSSVSKRRRDIILSRSCTAALRPSACSASAW